jgi:hypothetical protein
MSNNNVNMIIVPRAEVASWVINSIRNTLGEQDIRNDVISKLVELPANVVLGETLVLLYKETGSKDKQVSNYKAKVTKYINKITAPKEADKIYLFTVANPPEGEDAPETHYQTIILNNVEKKVYYIDPAHTEKGEEGIYAPHAVNNLIHPNLHAKGYSEEWLPVTHAAQTTEKDVFCQTWSLYLLVQGVQLLPGQKITIPSRVKNRYQVLINFWKGIAATSEAFCEVLLSDFHHRVQNEIKAILEESNNVNAANIPAILAHYMAVNPCEFIKTLTVKDIESI